METEYLKNKISTGFGLIEIVVGVAILTLSIFAIAGFYRESLQASRNTTQLIQASYLLEEGVEAVKIMRDQSWQDIVDLTPGMTYYLTFTGTKWATTTVNTFTDGVFERTIVVEDVYRDISDDIVSSGGTLDTNTKKITADVSWRQGEATTTRSISTYIANLFVS